MKQYIFLFILIFSITSCGKEALFSEQSRKDLWLLHEGAKLPIVVEGNTLSKVFVILLHGGPGGSAQVFNAEMKPFTNPMEEDYAMVYYDQRNAGLALGDWDEEKLNIEQHVDDLEKVIELLKISYGSDIQVFLAGHSWGGYLGTSFLLDTDRQSMVKAWININGLIHRNQNQMHALNRIKAIGEEQIANDINVLEWTDIVAKVQEEIDKSVAQYTVDSEGLVFDLIRLGEAQIRRDKVLAYNFNGPTSSIYADNYDPFRLIINGNRDKALITQMYLFDAILDSGLENINIPTLSIYGYYDVRTSFQQGEYLMDGISTSADDKAMVVLHESGHESPKNEPLRVAEEIKKWIEKYR